MNREILFRGKLESNGNWVEGYYTEIPIPSLGATIFDGSGESVICEDTESCIISITSGQHPNYSSAIPLQVVECEKYVVDPKTVGQWTGLLDKNGKRVFEGDVVRYEDYTYFEGMTNEFFSEGAVEYDQFGFYFTDRSTVNMEDFYINNKNEMEEVEIIGNIHEEDK